jgi:hypothetical protein
MSNKYKPLYEDAFSRFNKTSGMYLLAFGLSLAYGLGLYFIYSGVTPPRVSDGLPMLSQRLDWLESLDHSSYLAYSATVLTAMVYFPVALSVSLTGYFRVLVKPGLCEPCRVGAGYTLIWSWLFVLLGLWFFFVYVDGTFGEDYSSRKMGALFLWPVFPAFGIMVFFLLHGAIFVTMICVAKFLLLKKREHG